MNTTIKTIDIFVSSTFLDMHDERDLIKTEVMQKVNFLLEPKGLQVNFIDLRWGVNTADVSEQEREEIVLEKCLETIRKTRPYFLAIIGGRYGYLPSEVSYRMALYKQRNEILALDEGPLRSVTDLEIQYGALNDYLYFQKSIFCFRDSCSYKGMDKDTLGLFVDKDQTKLVELKDKIEYLCNEYDLQKNLIRYKCKWSKGHMTDFEDFPDRLAERIVELVQGEEELVLDIDSINEYSKLAVNDTLLSKELSNSYIRGHKKFNFRDGNADMLDALATISSSNEKIVIVSGETSSGKTTIIAALYCAYKNAKGFTPLVHYSRHNRNASQMVRKWLFELDIEQRQPIPSDSYISIEELLWELKNTAEEKEGKIVMLIDDITCLDNITAILDKNWMANNMSIIVTCNNNEIPYITSQNNYMVFNLQNEDDVRGQIVASFLFKKHHKKLSKKALNVLISTSCNLENNESKLTWSIIVADELAKFDTTDFESIRKVNQKRDDKKIEQYQINYIKNSPLSTIKLFSRAIDKLNKDFDSHFITGTLSITALFSEGVPITYLHMLLEECWDDLAFNTFCSSLDLFISKYDQRLICFTTEIYREYVLRTFDLQTWAKKAYDILVKDLNYSPNDDFLCIEALNVSLGGCIIDIAGEPLFAYKYARQKVVNAFIQKYTLNYDSVKKWIYNLSDKFHTERLRFLIDVAWHAYRIKSYGLGQHLAGILSQLALTWECSEKLHAEIYLLLALHSYKYDKRSSIVYTKMLNLAEQKIDCFSEDIVIDNQFLAYYYYLRSVIDLDSNQYMESRKNSYISTTYFDWLFKNGYTEVFDDLKNSENVHTEASINLDSKTDYLSEYNEERYEGEKWMLEQYMYASNAFIVNHWFNNDSICSILFEEAMEQMDRLSDISSNEHFYAGYVKGRLFLFNKIRSDRSKEVLDYLDELDNYFFHDEVTDSQIQCLLYLHKSNPTEYNNEYLQEYAKEHLDIENVSSTTDLSYLYSMLKLYNILNLDVTIILKEQNIQIVAVLLSFIIWDDEDSNIVNSIKLYLQSEINELCIEDEGAIELLNIIKLRNLIFNHFFTDNKNENDNYEHFKKSCSVFEILFAKVVLLSHSDIASLLLSFCFERITEEVDKLYNKYKDNYDYIYSSIHPVYEGVFRAYNSIKIRGKYVCWCKSKAYRLFSKLNSWNPHAALEAQAYRNWLLLWLFDRLKCPSICIELGNSLRNTLSLLDDITYNNERYMTYLTIAYSVYDQLKSMNYRIEDDPEVLEGFVDISYKMAHWLRMLGETEKAIKILKEAMIVAQKDKLRLEEEYGLLLHKKGENRASIKLLEQVNEAYKREYSNSKSERIAMANCIDYVENSIVTVETFLDVQYPINKIEKITLSAHSAIKPLWYKTKDTIISLHMIGMKYIRLLKIEAILYIIANEYNKIKNILDEFHDLSEFYLGMEGSNNAIIEILDSYSNISKVATENELYDLSSMVVDIDYELRKDAAEKNIIKRNLTDIEEYTMRKCEARGAIVYRR